MRERPLVALASGAADASSTVHHASPTGWSLGVLILLGLLYVGWRTGRLGKLRQAARALRFGGAPRWRAENVRVRPAALLPALLLVVVVAVLLVTHGHG